jgi:hypothetical protein
MKILNAIWFTDMGEPKSIGIVIAEVVFFALFVLIGLTISRMSDQPKRLSFQYEGETVLTAEYYPTRYNFINIGEGGKGYKRSDIQKAYSGCGDAAASKIVSFAIYDRYSRRTFVNNVPTDPSTPESYFAWRSWEMINHSFSTTTLNGSEFYTFKSDTGDPRSGFLYEDLVAFREGGVVIEIEYPAKSPYCLTESDFHDIHSIINSVKLEGKYK